MRPILRRAAVAGAAVLVAVLVWAVAARGAAEQRPLSRAPVSAPTATPTPAASVISVISDERSLADQGDVTVPPWTVLLERATGADVLSFSSGGAGYIARSSTSLFGGTFVARAQQVAPRSSVVIFFGGSHDVRETRLDLVDAATRAFTTAEAAAPRARVIVVGPLSTGDTPSSGLLQVRDDLRSAAALADVRFVDPIADGWLTTGSGLVAADGSSLTEAGQLALADRMRAVVAPDLP